MARLVSSVINDTVQRLRTLEVDMRKFRKGYGGDDELSGDTSILTELQNFISGLAAEAGAFTKLTKIDVTQDVAVYNVPAGIVSFQRAWYSEESIGGGRFPMEQVPQSEMFSYTGTMYDLNTDDLSFLSGGATLSANAPRKYSVMLTEAGDMRTIELYPVPPRTVGDALIIEVLFSPTGITEATDLETITPRHIAALFVDALTAQCCDLAGKTVPDRVAANADRVIKWAKERIVGEPTTTPINPVVYNYGR